MFYRTALAAILVTALGATPAAATPVGDPAQISAGRNLGLLYNPVDRIYVASTFVVMPTFLGYNATAVPRSGPLTAQSVFSEEFPPFGDPRVTHDPDTNRYLVLSGPEDSTLEGFLYAGNGTKLHAVTVPGAAAGASAVAYTPARGGYLVAYRQGTGLATQRLNSDGAPVGPSVPVADRADVTEIGGADIAYRPRFRDFLLVWEGKHADGASDVYARRLDTKGRELGAGDAPLSARRGAPAGEVNSAPAVAAGARGALVVWWDGSAVYGRKLGGRRARLREPRIRYSAAAGPGFPAPAADVAYHPSAREYLVVWPGSVTRMFGEFEAVVGVIFGQHTNRGGRPRGPRRFEVSPSDLPDPESASGPAVAAARHGGYLVSWELFGLARTPSLQARRVAPLR